MTIRNCKFVLYGRYSLIQLNSSGRGLRDGVHEAGVAQDLVDDGVGVGHPLTVGQAHLAATCGLGMAKVSLRD